jgi:hypothetical protein
VDIIRDEFLRRAREEAGIEADEDAAEAFYAKEQYDLEMECFALYLEDEKREAQRASRSFL